ncbi:hypothetical protein [Stakelama pacifica]|uniref:Membrane protein DUF2157 n=1 Tax=Stakelama pacifica TaxID=517720 RepID=A0A4R6FI24_9SPHN|nr:hypothetical protein [Stakelama pacifica]TDN81071.1 hypothetical protein EV664_10812 [Stakelama pacifica]GGO96667.1 hypothetical protein GCM10011329_23700 [Stakelama pacifica]
MYSEIEIDNAVKAGALSPQAAEAFRNHVAAQRALPAVDEEHFRLLSGFNDIFVGIAIALMLVAVAQIGAVIASWLGGAAVAVTAWLLAEFFTLKRRMALPSILLLIAFVGGVAGMLVAAMAAIDPDVSQQANMAIIAGIGLIATGAAWLHWRRFGVPITIAAGALGIAAMFVSIGIALYPPLDDYVWPLLLVSGVAIFLLAMRWDISDPLRQTRRADVAFWLHLTAAPLIAHSVFRMLGVFNSDIGPGVAAIVLALYLAFGFVALAVDRRALLVSSLAYVLYALYAVIAKAGAVELSAALAALVIGSALLTLSIFWHPMRRQAVAMLGTLGRKLPPVAMPAAA